MANVLITGAGGFIGLHLVKALRARGAAVTGLARKAAGVDSLQALGARVLRGDVTDRQSLRQAVAGQDVVFHLAGVMRPTRIRQFYEVNERGMVNVAETCAEQDPPPTLVIVSTAAASGPSRSRRPLVESDPPRPICHYGRSKRAGELAAQRVADRVPITVVRPCGTFGAPDRNFLAIFQSVARLGLHFTPVWPTLETSLIHVADLVHLLILAAERGWRLPPPGQTGQSAGQGGYFAASGEFLTPRQLAQMLGKAVGRDRVRLAPVPSPLIWTAAAAGEAASWALRRRVLVSFDRARQATAGCWFCSPRAAIEQLGFSLGAPLVDRLRQTAQWYRAQGLL